MPPTLAEQHAFLDAAKAFDFATVKARVTADPSYTNVQPCGRWTAIHQTAYKGDVEMVKFLLANGADVKVTNTAGQTPKQVAEQQGNFATATLLAAAEADEASGKSKKRKGAAGSSDAPKSQKVSLKHGVVQTKFDAASSR